LDLAADFYSVEDLGGAPETRQRLKRVKKARKISRPT
jgi:hypothetical protein